MTTDLRIMTESLSVDILARLARSLDVARTADDLASIITDPETTESVLIQVVNRVKTMDSSAYQDVNRLMYLVLASPICTQGVIDVADDYFHRIPLVVRAALEKDLYLSPAAMEYASADRWHQRDVDYRKIVMTHSCVTASIISKYANDWRVTISRIVAKHPLLSLTDAQPLLSSKDAKTRANVAGQPWVPVETLHLYRNDPDSSVVKAAKRALAARSLPESDEIDAVMDDEVSLFFLAASDDEATIKRLGSSLNSPEETLRMVAGIGAVGAHAVAANASAPPDLIESMSIEASSHAYSRDRELAVILAANPRNTGAGLSALSEASRWNYDMTLLILRNPNCTPSIAREKAKQHGARLRIAAINTGFLTRDEMDYIIAHEYRDGVLRAFVECKEALVSDLQTCYARGGEKVKALAAARLVELKEPLEVVEVQENPTAT